jgi:uncharacterized protein
MRFCVAFLILFVAPALHAASFDCAKASSTLQRSICSDAKLSAADSTMAALYRNDLAQLSSNTVGLLRADQVQWLAWAQQLCHTTEDIARHTVIAECLKPLYADRIKVLRKAVLHLDDLAFLTRTQYLAAVDSPGPAGKPQSPDHPGFGTLTAVWPAADTNDPDWTAWNRTVEQSMLVLAAPDDKAPPTGWSDDLAADRDTEITAALKSVEHGRATATFTFESMQHGGAHPYEIWHTVTYVLAQHRGLAPDDVFAAGADWKSAVAEACWHQMSTGDKKTYIYAEVTGPDAKPIQDTIGNPTNWTLEPDGLHISFPEYSVSPRYAQMDDAVIPWAALAPVLNPAFIHP